MNAARAPGAAKAIGFAAVLVVLAGYVVGFRADAARVGEQLAENERILAQVAADERTLRARGALLRRRDALRARLRAVDLGGDRTSLVARFVRDAERIAARHRTTIAAITAEAAAQTPAGTFDAIPLDFTIDGRYADVLATVGALSTARVPAAVEVTSLARKHAGSPDATLTAQVRVVIERLVPTVKPDVRARPA